VAIIQHSITGKRKKLRKNCGSVYMKRHNDLNYVCSAAELTYLAEINRYISVMGKINQTVHLLHI